MSKPDIEKLVAYNRIGWHAIQHKDGWWLGNKHGVICYGEHDLAKYALTMMWLRDKKKLNFRILPFTGADKMTGTYTPKRSANAAMSEYMKHK